VLQALELLHADGNQLQELPTSIGRATRLNTLTVTSNKIR
jgi:Leucine-rich repeat (LRR) protein